MASIRTILRGVNVLLLVGLALSTAWAASSRLEQSLVDNTEPPQLKRHKGTTDKNQRPVALSNFQAVLDANIFRAQRSQVVTSVMQKPQQGSISVGSAPPSDTLPISITLTGTMVMGSNSVAFVIGENGKKEKVYRLKDCLPSVEELPTQKCSPQQAQVVKISSNTITVAINQRNYLVELGKGTPEAAPSRPGLNSKMNPKKRRNRSQALSRGKNKKGGTFPSKKNGNNIEFKVPNTEVEKAFENFSNILNDARVSPYMVEGTPQGFIINKIRPGSIFEQIGLNNSDILKSVNGQSLTTADQALRLFTAFQNEREIAIEIERGGQSMTMSYVVQ